MKKKLLFMAIALVYSLGFSQSGTCAGATALVVTDPGGEFDYSLTPPGQTTIGKGNSAGNSSPDVFYTLTPGAAYTVNIGICQENDFDSQIKIYSDCTLTDLIAENDDGGGLCGFQARVSFQSDAVSTYVIMVEGSDTPHPSLPDDQGNFGISVWYEAAVPTPDAPEGINCTPSISGPSILFTDQLDVQGTWTGDISTTAGGGTATNTGMWEIWSPGGSTSNNTGPSAPFIGTTYMNYESSGVGNSDTASAVSEAIDLTGTIVEDAELTFYMHAYGNNMGTLNVGVGNSPSGPFTAEFTWSGQFQSSEDDDWFQVGVDLSSYLGQTIHIEFSHTGTGGLRGDMSIDFVEINACDTVLDINDEEIIDGLTLYPNPVNNILHLNAIDEIEEVSVYNLLGQQVKLSNPSNSRTSIDMTNLETGLYIVKVKAGAKTGSYKVIKE